MSAAVYCLAAAQIYPLDLYHFCLGRGFISFLSWSVLALFFNGSGLWALQFHAPLYNNYIARIKSPSVGRPVSCDCALTVATQEATAQCCSQFCNEYTCPMCGNFVRYGVYSPDWVASTCSSAEEDMTLAILTDKPSIDVPQNCDSYLHSSSGIIYGIAPPMKWLLFTLAERSNVY